MAAVTVATAGQSGYVDPVRGIVEGSQADTETIVTVGTFTLNRARYITRMYYVTVAADGDVMADPGFGTIKMAFWKGAQRHQTVTDHVTVSIASDNSLIFECAAAADGYLLLFIDAEDPSRAGKRAL